MSSARPEAEARERTDDPNVEPRPGRLSQRQKARLLDSLWPTLAIVASLGFLVPLLAIADADIGAGFRILFGASFGSNIDFGYFLLTAVPLVLVGLGVAIPYRAGMFNIGGEGQLLVGALAAVVVAVSVNGIADVPGGFLVPLAAALIAGGVLGFIAGALKAWRGIHEIVTTIMLSFLAMFLVQYLTRGPFQAEGAVYPTSEVVPSGLRLGAVGPDALVPVGFIVALVTVGVATMLTFLTRRGWRQRLIGLNPRLAQRRGARVGWEQALVLAIGGALAGMGGATEALGNQFRVGTNFSPGWGFDAVAIALLARGNPLAVLPFALYFGFLRNGANVLQSDLQVSPDLVLVMGALPVIFVAAIVGYRGYKQAITEAPAD